MSQFYSIPEREDEPHALPDCELFYRTAAENAADGWIDSEGDPYGEGWYWWACFPGCLPDSDPIGPFATKKQAIDDARNY